MATSLTKGRGRTTGPSTVEVVQLRIAEVENDWRVRLLPEWGIVRARSREWGLTRRSLWRYLRVAKSRNQHHEADRAREAFERNEGITHGVIARAREDEERAREDGNYQAAEAARSTQLNGVKVLNTMHQIGGERVTVGGSVAVNLGNPFDLRASIERQLLARQNGTSTTTLAPVNGANGTGKNGGGA